MDSSKNKIENWLPHIAGILLFIILPLFVFDRNNDRAIFWIYSYYYQLLFMLIAFYVNYLIIVPRFYFSRRKIHYFLVVFLFALILLITLQYFNEFLPSDSFRHAGDFQADNPRPKSRFGIHPKMLENFFLLLVVLGFSSGMAITQHLRKNETRQKEIEKARVDSELAFLRNQISPHFFFNSLNNIYALIDVDRTKAQKAVEKLSMLMRYLIYDSNTEVVELQKEVDFTWKYIDLMRLRLSPKVKLEVNIDKNLPDVGIPPLLLIPFVENAFKHGISYRGNSFITILLSADADNVIFECRNSIAASNGSKSIEGGLGIENIKKRLDLIYGNTYRLTINRTDEDYFVLLTVPGEVHENA